MNYLIILTIAFCVSGFTCVIFTFFLQKFYIKLFENNEEKLKEIDLKYDMECSDISQLLDALHVDFKLFVKKQKELVEKVNHLSMSYQSFKVDHKDNSVVTFKKIDGLEDLVRTLKHRVTMKEKARTLKSLRKKRKKRKVFIKSDDRFILKTIILNKGVDLLVKGLRRSWKF